MAVLSKFEPTSVTFGIEGKYKDRIVSLQFEKHCLVNVYSPYSGVDLCKLQKRKAWEESLFTYLLVLSRNNSVILCGDFNVILCELDVHPLEKSQNVAGCADGEKNWFSELLSIGFCDVDRSLFFYSE